MKINLVEDWRRMWRWLSVQLMVAAGFAEVFALGLREGWEVIPQDLKAALPATWVSAVAVALTIAAIVGRVIKQGKA